MVTSRQSAVGSRESRPFVGEWEREYPFEDRWLDLGEVRMHYIDESSTFDVRGSELADSPHRTPNPEHRTLLFLHGNPTWSFYWRHLIAHFRDTHRCVAPDHMGCGMSDKPQHYPYTLAQHIDNTVSLVHALDLRDIVLCVHDWGGAIGMGVAARIPDRVRGFVVCNTAAFPFDRMPLSIGLCRIPGFGALAIRGFNAFVRGALARCARKPLTAEAKAGYLAPYSSWEDRVANLRFVQDIPMEATHESWSTLADVEAALPGFIDHPMLLCWGGRDFVFTEEFLGEWQRRFPNAQTQLYPESGHFVVEDARAEIIEAMEEFLPKVPAA
jgi:haloalkane dehalogenase